MLKRILIAGVLLTALTIPLALNAQEDELPAMILAARPGYHPEGIDWDAARGVFVTGSITEGGVFTVDDAGTVTPLGAGHEGLGSTGVHVDATRNRVLVAMPDFAATSNPEAPGSAALAAYDLDTGEELFFVDMTDLDGGRDFANDVTVDSEGNAYLTTSFSGVIYKVDPEGNGEILIATPDFAAQGFGLNGIDYHPGGNFLLVAVAGKGAIYKVPVDDPQAYTQVAMESTVGIDGMVLYEDGYLYAVGNVDGAQAREVVVIGSEDDWASATILSRQTAQAELSPTTLAMRDGAAYVVHAKFGSIGSDPAVETFEIQRFTFEGMGSMVMSGDALIDAKCATCHTRERIDNAQKDEAGWTATVDRMIGYGIEITEEERAALIAHLAGGGGAAVMMTGDELIDAKCTTCHSRERIDAAQKDEAGWTATVDRMIGYGIEITAEERAALIAHLAGGM
jgi:sugar lactone lactonase YvrE